MHTKRPISRRSFLRHGGNVVAAGSVLSMLPELVAAAAKPITVGFIYVGPRQDFGWNQAHWDAARKIAKMDGVTVVEQENVPETAEVEKVMKSMIQLDGARVIMATSFGYWKSVLKMAEANPEVLFTHIGAIWKPGNPKNVIGYRGYMEEPHYLCGIAAGRMTKTGKIGFIGSKPLYFIFNNCNGFVLGARSVRPDTSCNVVITGEWNNPVKEAETTNSLIDQGCDVIIANVDSSKVSIETAERRGVYSCGYHSDCSSLAPKGFLTGAEWNWASAADFVRAWQTGGSYPNLLRGGFKRDMVAISPFGAALPQGVRDEILAGRQGFIDDSLQLYKGPLQDNKGNVILKAGEVIDNEDTKFKLGVRFFVEGAVGETGLK
jgi:simple sugar transport system substrate-binding protein